MTNQKRIYFHVVFADGSSALVHAECERDVIEWFESFNKKPTRVITVSNPGRWDKHTEIPPAVSRQSIQRSEPKQDYKRFGEIVARILRSAGEDYGSDVLGEIANAAADCGVNTNPESGDYC